MRTRGRSSDLHYKYGPFSFLQRLTVISNVAASPHFPTTQTYDGQQRKRISPGFDARLPETPHSSPPFLNVSLRQRCRSGHRAGSRSVTVPYISELASSKGFHFSQRGRSPEICHTPLKPIERTFDSIKVTAEPEVSFHHQTAALCNSNITGSASDLT